MENINRFIIYFFFLSALCDPAKGQIITIVAGSDRGFGGDGGLAIDALLNFPYGIATDRWGGLYIGDLENFRIRKVDTLGIISSIAGTGIEGNSGDGGPATRANIFRAGIALDYTGNIYLAADTDVRKINTHGIITRISGAYGNPEIAVDKLGNLYIGDGNTAQIKKMDTAGVMTLIAGTGTWGYSGDGGAATAAQIYFNSQWSGIAVDSIGNIYFTASYRVRKIDTAGIISTIAGTGTAGYSGDGGPATAAELNNPGCGIATDATGNIFICDGNNYRIREVNTSGIITTIAGTGLLGYSGDGLPATATNIGIPMGIAIDTGGSVYYNTDAGQAIFKIINNYHAPYFTGGHSQALGVCAGTSRAINTVLSVNDTDAGQHLVWSIVTLPLHGSLAAAYTATATGGIVTPTGLSYTPGGTGSGWTDSFRVRVSDGIQSDTTTIHVTVSTIAAIGGATSVCTGATAVVTDAVSGGVWSSPGFGYAAVGSGTGIVTGVYPGSAVISYTLSSGCAVTTTLNVIYGPSPIGGDSTVCVGAAIGLGTDAVGGHWSSSAIGVATVGTGIGLVTGVSAGTVVISYSLSTGCYTTKLVTVFPLPGPITGTLHVCAGSETTLSDATTGGTWASPSFTAVATIGSGTGTGTVTGVSSGTAIITYTSSAGCKVMATATVNPLPTAITGSLALCAGATGVLADATTGGTWGTAGTVAGIGASSGALSAVSAGTETVTYTLGTGCVATAVLAVNPLPLPILGVSAICEGSTTTLYDSSAGGVWGSGATAISLSSAGVVTGVSAGTAVITYSLGGCSVSRAITVNPTPAPISGAANGCAGLTSLLTDGTSGGTWATSDTSVATLGAGTGILTGRTGGAVTITYILSTGCMATTGLTVNPTPTVITGPAALCSGAAVTFADSTSGGEWSSGTGSGSLSAGSLSGVVTGVAVGSAVVSYVIGGCNATKVIVVLPLPDAITGPDSVCSAGFTVLEHDATPLGHWTSIGVTVDTTGLITSFAAGEGIISYTIASGCYVTKTITVMPSPGTISGSAYACLGGSITLTDGTGGGLWGDAGYGSFASVGSGSGVVTGITTGTAIITYVLPTGCFSTKIISVNPLPQPITGGASICVGATMVLNDTTAGGAWGSGAAGVAEMASGVVTGISAGTALISYSVTNLCGTAVVTKPITVNPLPDAGTITGPEAVCVGAQVALADLITGGVWAISNGSASLSGGTVTGVAPGADTISYSVTNTCGTATATQTITVNPLPFAGVITGPDSLCPGDTVTVIDPISGGTWASSNAAVCGVSNTGLVTGYAQGIDTVSYTVTNSCGSAAAIYPFTVRTAAECTNGVGNVQMCKYANVQIYPNPNNGSFTVEYSGAISNALMEIYNTFGQRVLRQALNTNKTEIDLHCQAAGVYFFRAFNADGSLLGEGKIEVAIP